MIMIMYIRSQLYISQYIYYKPQYDRKATLTPRNDRNVKQDKHKAPENNARKCKFCGEQHQMRKELCPAWQQRCRKCNGRNHFAKMCRRDSHGDVHGIRDYENDPEVSSEESDDSHYDFLSGIDIKEFDSTINAIDDKTAYKRFVYTEMIINKENFQIDCGASVNIINEKYTKGNDVQPTTKALKMWNGTELKPIGIIRLIIKNAKIGKKFSIEFVVVPNSYTPIIGARAAQQMKLITVHADNFTAVPPSNVNNVSMNDDLVKKYEDVFLKELGTLPGEVHLQVDERAQPSITPPRRVPIALKDKYKEELKRLEDLQVLAKVDEPTEWVSSVVIATKKSGALRICIDPRPLNQALKRETYQLPILDDLMPELSKAKIFSTVDLTAGYWHCVLDDESSLLTTFATPFCRYRWRRLPFGLSASSEIFQN